MSSTLFISDLHLSDNTPEIEDALYAFLLRERRMARLFILGDFFEYWIGDDDDTPLNRRVIKQLRAASDRGTELFLVRGNRDLALGSVFANQIGATLLGDTTVISLDGKPTLVLHGDTLCTDDIEYQKMRTILHDPAWQAEMLQRPLEERREFARGLRNASQEKADKDPANINGPITGETLDSRPHTSATDPQNRPGHQDCPGRLVGLEGLVCPLGKRSVYAGEFQLTLAIRPRREYRCETASPHPRPQ